MKLLFLVLHRAEKAWIMPPREWTMAKAQFAILFSERFTKAQTRSVNKPTHGIPDTPACRVWQRGL